MLFQYEELSENYNQEKQLIGKKMSKHVFKVQHTESAKKSAGTRNTPVKKENKQSLIQNTESSNLFSSYAFEYYAKSLYLDHREVVNLKLFPRQKNFFRQRTRVTDFMVEVFSAFSKSDIPTLFHAVRLMDAYLSKSHVEDKQFFLICVTCIFISSKYEDTHCIRMGTLIKNVAHNNLTMEEVKQQEILILRTIEWDLMFTTTYEFIKMLFFELAEKKKKDIEKLRLTKALLAIEAKAIAAAMIMLHNEHYCEVKNLPKAIVSILYAMNLLSSDQSMKDTYITIFIKDWVDRLIKETQTSVEYVNLFLKNFEQYMDVYQKIQYIGKHAWKYIT